jgi:hypothetical protein
MDMKIDLKRSLQFQGDTEIIKNHLSDLPTLLNLFPKLNELKELKPGSFQWTLKPIGAAGVEHVVVYGAQYNVDLEAMKISWVAVKGVGNATLEGYLQVIRNGSGVELSAHIEGQLRNMSIPLALRLVTPTYIKKTFEALVDRFLEKLRDHLTA